MAQTEKNLPVVQETRIWSLGGEDPLEKGMATHSSILAWRIPWTEELVGYSLWGHKELDVTEQLLLSLSSAFGYHKFVFYIWVCFVSKFIFIIFLDSTCKWYTAFICLFLSDLFDLFHWALYSLGSSMLLQMSGFFFMAK